MFVLSEEAARPISIANQSLEVRVGIVEFGHFISLAREESRHGNLLSDH
jgi:hypothetical protein